MRYILLFMILLISLYSCAPHAVKEKPRYDYGAMDKTTAEIYRKTDAFVHTCQTTQQPLELSPAVRIDSVRLARERKNLDIYFNKAFSYPAWRVETVRAVYQVLQRSLGRKYRSYRLTLYTLSQPLGQLVPNYYRPDPSQYDLRRMPVPTVVTSQPLITPLSRPYHPLNGLLNRCIDVRPSHGWYYNTQVGRWEWQRPRMFETVEDLLPYSFVIPYLAPMLENAGATVFLPRERDTQTHEVVVDNDVDSAYTESPGRGDHAWSTGTEPGFAPGPALLPLNYNPFLHGTYRTTFADSVVSAWAVWTPDIPETAEYAVYVSYHHSPHQVPDAHYTVRHSGGRSEFLLNQRKGGSTWIYLGRFHFQAGRHPDSGSVVLDNRSTGSGKVSADAVRFGGGMGNILREGATSGRPRFAEGSKYYLQYAGFPDTLTYNQYKNKDDYRDDYVGRSEYANYLYGAPFGPKKDRNTPGLRVPVDLSLAFHTDAGITRNDTTIGTLAIYSARGSDSLTVFPDGISRLANRDLADMVQSQIVQDMRSLYDPAWNRRQVMEGDYSEAVRPNMPAALIELLSHQNFTDMKFALDPRFRFDAARALYKGMLKFVAFQHRRPYTVQPLPVTHVHAAFTAPGQVTLGWKPRFDPLEDSAGPQGYIIYKGINGGGFDNGTLVHETGAIFSGLNPGVLYDFKISAVNSGGASFPSEVLSVCWQDNGRKPVLIINGFDRICGPAGIETPLFSGFADFLDQGVPDGYALNYTGRQTDLTPGSPYISNDAPGHGASQAAHETQLIAGNTFDFARVHGRSLLAAGYAFVSSSDEAVMDSLFDLTAYRIWDLILGEEKTTAWPKTAMDSIRGKSYQAFPSALQVRLARFLGRGGGLFVSGAYVGTDLYKDHKPEDASVLFAQKALHIKWAAGYASVNGEVTALDEHFFPDLSSLRFNTALTDSLYCVEAPDAIDPLPGARTILRFSENRFSAGTAFRSKEHAVVVFGFPFETILGIESRNKVMHSVLKFLTKDL